MHEPNLCCTDASSVTPSHQQSQLFCEVIREEDIAMPSDDYVMDMYWSGQGVRRQNFLQQLFSLHRCSVMIRDAMRVGASFDYIVRVRPDMAWIKPMPPITSLILRRNVIYTTCYTVDGVVCKLGPDQIEGKKNLFYLGDAAPMLALLERFSAFMNRSAEIMTHYDNTAPGIALFAPTLMTKGWSAESFMYAYMHELNISFQKEARIQTHVVRPKTGEWAKYAECLAAGVREECHHPHAIVS